MIKFSAAEDRIVRPFTSGVNDRVNDKEKEVLCLLYEDPGYTIDQLSDYLKVSRKTIAARIKSLKEKNIITRIGSSHKGYWKILE